MSDDYGIGRLVSFLAEDRSRRRASVIEEACERMITSPYRVGVFVDEATGDVRLSRHVRPDTITYFHPPDRITATRYRFIPEDTP